jgi:hypothetical protein
MTARRRPRSKDYWQAEVQRLRARIARAQIDDLTWLLRPLRRRLALALRRIDALAGRRKVVAA